MVDLLFLAHARRKNIVIVLASYLLILVVTAIFFVPKLISITTTALSQTADPGLIKRASLWEVTGLLHYHHIGLT